MIADPAQPIRLRLTKVDEYQFVTCVKHGLWGSKTDRFKNWQLNDLLVVFVGKYLAGMGHVSGDRFKSLEPVWDNGLFPHRIPIGFDVVLLPEHRPPILGEIRDALASAFPSGGYGLGILNQLLVPEKAARPIVEAMRTASNDVGYVSEHIDSLLTDAKAQRDAEQTKRRLTPSPPPVSDVNTTAAVEAPIVEADEQGDDEESLHSKIESHLIELGLIVGCSVWVAPEDKNRMYRGKLLGAACLDALPNLGLAPDPMRRMSHIDIIWFRHNAPLYAFEVEATTAVYSGLLRLSDLLALVPALKLKLFIVAPISRQSKVLGELARPTFDKIGLSDYCAFLPAEELEGLIMKLSGLAGHLHPSIIETVQIEPVPQGTGGLE